MTAPTVLQTGSRDTAGTISLTHAATAQAIVAPHSINNWWGYSLDSKYEGVTTPGVTELGATGSSSPLDADTLLCVLTDLSGSSPANSLVVSAGGGEWKFKGMVIGHSEPLELKAAEETAWTNTGASHNPLTVSVDPGGVDCIAVCMLVTKTAHTVSNWTPVPGSGYTDHWWVGYSRHQVRVFSVPVLAGAGATAIGFDPSIAWYEGYVTAVLLGPVEASGRNRSFFIF